MTQTRRFTGMVLLSMCIALIQHQLYAQKKKTKCHRHDLTKSTTNLSLDQVVIVTRDPFFGTGLN